MPPKVNNNKRVKLSQGECLEIRNNLTEIGDSYEPLVNEVGFLMNSFRKVRSKVENLENFAELFGTKLMKDNSKRLLKKLGDCSMILEKMYIDIEYTQGKTKDVDVLFKDYEKFCMK
jgi:hypothetical protein